VYFLLDKTVEKSLGLEISYLTVKLHHCHSWYKKLVLEGLDRVLFPISVPCFLQESRSALGPFSQTK
jgi:hypothetical protein